MIGEPMLLVMMMMVFLKSTVRPLAVGEAAIIEHLQQNIENVVVRFFDFIEEHDGIRPAPDRFAELAAFFVADVARRRADEPGDGVFLHVFAHVDADHGVFVIEQKFRERAGGFGFADAGRPEKNEGADRPIRILQAAAGATHGIGDGLERLLGQ